MILLKSMLGEMTFSQFIRNKIVWLFFAIDVIIIIAIIALSINNATKDATIVFNITPTDASITLNGQGGYESNGTYQIHPGEYTIVISRDGLDSKTFNVDLDHGTNTTITTYLTQGGNVDFYKQRSQLSSFNKLRELATSNNNSTTDQDTSAYDGISNFYADQLSMSSLPINETYYENTDSGRKLVYDVTIRKADNENCQTWLCLEALVLGTDDQSVVTDILNARRFKVEDYEIQYKMY